jgi:hypothetical protein
MRGRAVQIQELEVELLPFGPAHAATEQDSTDQAEQASTANLAG